MSKSFYTTHSGALFVSPGGQSEQGPQMAAVGYSWGAVDIVDQHPWADWSTTVKSLVGAGLRVPVWGRVQNASIAQIIDVGAQFHVPCLLDIEDEFKTTIPPAVAEMEIRAAKAAHSGYTREIVINTNGWLYNDVDYSPLAHRPLQLQIMVSDMHLSPADLPRVTNDCIVHARLKGFRDIGVTFQAFGAAEPEWYDYWAGKPRSYFTGDWIGAQSAWGKWPA